MLRGNQSLPDRPTLRESNWEWYGEKYYYRTPDGRLARQDKRIPWHYAKPPRKVKPKRTTARKAVDRKTAAAKGVATRQLRAEQADLIEGLKAIANCTEGKLTPHRARELAAGFEAAGMAHLIG